MKILVTGSSGFIGQNLCEALMQIRDCQILKVNSKTSEKELKEYLQNADFVYHLAATHRPKDNDDFRRINIDYFEKILKELENQYKLCPIVFTSSIQAGNGSNYGNSKVEGEKLILSYAERTGARTHILRLTNTFGKYARPNHTSVVATFCYNISHNLPIIINDKNSKINLCYIDDVIEELISYIEMNSSTIRMIDSKKIISTTVGQLAKDINNIANNELPTSCNSKYHLFLTKTYKWYKGQE